MKRYQFEVPIVAGRGGGAFVEIPFDVKEEFGTGGQVRITATFDGVSYRGSIAPMGGGKHVLGIRKAIRAEVGKDVGDLVAVVMEEDTAERVVEIPEELSRAFDGHPDARTRFLGKSYTFRRETAEWVGGAKKAETRSRRAGQAIERIVGGG